MTKATMTMNTKTKTNETMPMVKKFTKLWNYQH